MLPVFLWRVRHQLDARLIVALARRRRLAAALGYFLDVAATVAASRAFEPILSKLRPLVPIRQRPTYFFRKMRANPFEAMAARTRTPEAAHRWGLLTGTPTDSFETYFRKVRDL